MQAGLAETRGNRDEAAPLRELARAEINTLASQTGSEEMRASFLARPEIRSILRLSR